MSRKAVNELLGSWNEFNGCWSEFSGCWSLAIGEVSRRPEGEGSGICQNIGKKLWRRRECGKASGIWKTNGVESAK